MIRARLLAPLLFCAVAVTASAQAPYGLVSSPRMKHDQGDSWTYVKPGLNLARYRGVSVDTVGLYAGSDAEFGSATPDERRKYANLLGEAVRAALGKSVPIVARGAKGTLRLKLTLLGVKKTIGGVATATRVTPIGLATSALKSARGKKGTLSGSVLFAAELLDGATGEVQVAAIRRRAPDALDIPATLSTGDTVKAVGRAVGGDIGKHLASRLGHHA
ncbi:MAG: DUF3313 domain-containing protein [Allosphingosinicella sp.]